MNSGAWIHFDTLFNGFMKRKWSKYTHLNNLNIELEVKGTLRISIINKERERDGTVTNRCIDEIEVVCPERKWIKIPVKQFDHDGMYTFSMYAISNNCFVYGGFYSSDIPEDKIRQVKIGIAICTYRREEYILRNLGIIKKRIERQQSALKNHLEVFISDNGNTLNDLIKPEEYVHLYGNKNVGGAGGFTRCLIEILNNPQLEVTHALLMDDDVTIEPEAIFRTFTFLSILKDEYLDVFIGGSMMRLDKQTIQTESGAVWNKGKLESLKHNLDLRTCESCLYNDIEESCDYNAWWYCTIPMKFVRMDNLPLPIFIRGDDVEYGLRNAKTVVHLNGICVWHEPFENKYSSMMYYYILRNMFIDNAVRGIDFPLKQAIGIYLSQWNNEIQLCRYKNAHLLTQGIEDYLKGIDWLKTTDAEQLNQEIRENGYKMTSAVELSFNWKYKDYIDALNYSKPKDGIITKMRIKTGLMRHKKVIVAPTFDPIPRRCVDARKILNYDYASGKGFITKYNRKKYKVEKKYRNHIVKMMKKKYNRVTEEFDKRSNEIMNIDFWNQYLGL